jgi:hypothetical protein
MELAIGARMTAPERASCARYKIAWREALMYGVVVTVQLDPDRADEARELFGHVHHSHGEGTTGLNSGTWMRSPDRSSGRGVILLEDEDAANGLAGRAAQGPPPGAPAKFVSAEIFEVLAEA